MWTHQEIEEVLGEVQKALSCIAAQHMSCHWLTSAAVRTMCPGGAL